MRQDVRLVIELNPTATVLVEHQRQKDIPIAKGRAALHGLPLHFARLPGLRCAHHFVAQAGQSFGFQAIFDLLDHSATSVLLQ